MKLRYMPILVATALFLSAASGSNKEHQNKTSAHHYSASRKPEPTPSPFKIIIQPAPVQIIQPSPTIEKPQAHQKWYQRPTITDWGILVVTLLYTVISVGLLKATRTSLVETRKAADAATKSANAAADTATAAVSSVRAAEDNAKASREQADLAKQAVVLTHRPRVIARNFVIEQFRPQAAPIIQLFSPGHHVEGHFYITNVGSSKAILRTYVYHPLSTQTGLPMERPDEGVQGIPSGRAELDPGESTAPGFTSPQLGPEGALISSATHNWAFYLIGWIEYLDEIGITRKTFFCRKWDALTRRFHPVDDTDYERAD